ncbi:MAG: efflux RND transporter periplasmic adaptor subunit [Gemmatimonadales bacterium]
MNRSLRLAVVLLLTASCGGKPATPSDAAPPPANIATDNIAIVDTALVESGPSLSGTLAPERAAQLRAQVGGALLGLYVDEGAAVSAGQTVALIDTVPLAESARSARSQLISAQLAADVAKRNYERSGTLHGAGAIADRDLELAHNQSAAADAGLADARSRANTAEHLLVNAIVRAPFAGVVSERPASAGDVLQVGAPILTVVDPTRLQLEASVPADQLSNIRVGGKVEFTVTGALRQAFAGRIARINPSVDPTTRQVRLYVSVPNAGRALAAGAFVEGRVAVTSVRALTVPLAALDTRAAAPSVKRVHNGIVESVAVTLGVRDDLAERVQVTGGVSLGDTLLVGGVLSTPAGVAVRIPHANR